MPGPQDLEPQECERLLRDGVVGRVALSTPDGPHIIPVNYSIFEDTIAIRTSSYSLLGTYGRNTMLAFEVDQLDHDRLVGWTVTARGRAWAETDPAAISAMRAAWAPHPWASGSRNVYLRLRWRSLSGRSMGSDWTRDNESQVHRTLHAL